jgi:hypothetical protein
MIDATCGATWTWNGFANGGGWGLEEVGRGERGFAIAMAMFPIGRFENIADDVARVGMRTERTLARVTEGVFAPRTGAYTPGFDRWGKSLGKLEGKEIRVSRRGIDMVKEHLRNPFFDQTTANAAMIQRLEDAFASGSKISGADASFYLHELAETTIMRRLGLGYVDEAYSAAHGGALLRYDVSPYSVYHPEVMLADPGDWNPAFFKFWGIEP